LAPDLDCPLTRYGVEASGDYVCPICGRDAPDHPGDNTTLPDVERLVAALRLVRRTSRCPEYVAEALAEWERRQSPATAEAIVQAAERMECRSDAPEYVRNEVCGVEDVMVSAELARPAS
jgi:hypothetical protein